MSGIKKIILDVNGKETKLTMDEARELHGILDELFSKEKEYVPSWFPPYHPTPIWYSATTGNDADSIRLSNTSTSTAGVME